MSKLPFPDYMQIDLDCEIGTYVFEEQLIIDFASKYDPQYFHVDKERAKGSLFAGLCASGWHTLSVWMKLQRAFTNSHHQNLIEASLPVPELGPSPGIKDVKWPRPVYANDRITYYSKLISARETQTKPGWYILKHENKAFNSNNQMVLSFEGTVFIKFP